MNNSKFMELSNEEIMGVEGDGIGGAAIGFVGGIGYGLCKGAFKALRTGDNSSIWKQALYQGAKNGVKGAFLPF